ncbi:hypothetical protein S4054249_14110 [Pseudoalteromonas luteoviolacea]|uniref:Ig-like domain-containing protein n=2 Tax=Pseudoalteromonas luteoviolacea TaxID=43657 RepID=A0A0F6A3V5_9GAMM|nr:hypothetical protein S4054249_14110 [Pseudoalteromonas luteoviolacea]AOT13835.1 hypothetical protein S40542_14080 [Pseudoalteromonas luteoviolacea]AOT18750.1 hypothetical protein S4054_14085 [Pseudoalteromonas luteoviolacea]KKE80877.1 hypothetical protein N479_04155 [Pseudoalteromonas luteoviolacea S4054]KZN70989.1 hypothetical protein N481_19980 [Pseudoalteromonas luteoviolacea S4047-1]
MGLVAGCGGGSSENTNEEVKPPVITNSAPVVLIEGEVQVQEMQALNLVAKAHDKESQSLSYTWSHNGSAQITLEGATDASVTVRSMDLTQDTPILLSVTVTDAHGATAIAKHVVTVIDAPEVSIDVKDQTIEQSTFSLHATVNSSKAINSYQWSGHTPDSIEVSGFETDSLVIKSGDITEDIPLTFDLTVTDETGGQTTVSQSVLIKSFAQQLIISAKVTDQPIEHAHVQAQLGDKVFTTTANNQGEYTLAINLEQSEEAYINELVKLTATGQDQQDFVEFVSQLGSLSQLNLAAGTDAVLSAEELFDVNITNVTTAEYALLSEFEDAFDSVEKFENRRLGISAKQKLDIATVIKAIVDNDSVHLPEGHTTTLDLAKDKEAANQYLTKLQEEQPELVQSTVDALKSDADLLQPSSITFDEVIWVTEPDYMDGFYFGLDLKEDSTGYVIANGRHPVSWEQNNGLLTVHFDEPLILNNVNHIDRYNRFSLLSITLEFYTQGAQYHSSNVTLSGYDTDIGPQSSRTASFHSQVYTQGSFAELSKLTFDGNWSVFTVTEFVQDTYQEYYFDETNKLTVLDTQTQLDWLISGNELRIHDGERTQVLQLIAYTEFGFHFMGHTLENGVITEAYTAYMVKQQDVSFDAFDYQRTWVPQQRLHSTVFEVTEQGVFQAALRAGRQYLLELGELVSYHYSFNGQGRYETCNNSELCDPSVKFSYKLLAAVGDKIAVEHSVTHLNSAQPSQTLQFYDVVEQFDTSINFYEQVVRNAVNLYGEDGSAIRGYLICPEQALCFNALTIESQSGQDNYKIDKQGDHIRLTSLFTGRVLFLEFKEVGQKRYSICLKSDISAQCNVSNTQEYGLIAPTIPVSTITTGNGRVDLRTQNVKYGYTVDARILADDGHYISSLSICGEEGILSSEDILSELFWSVPVYENCEIKATFEEKSPAYGTHQLYDQSLYIPSLHEFSIAADGKGVYTQTLKHMGVSQMGFTWQHMSENKSLLEFDYPVSTYLKNYYNDRFAFSDYDILSHAVEFGYADEMTLTWQLEDKSFSPDPNGAIGPITFTDMATSEISYIADWEGKWVLVYQNSETYYEVNINADGHATLQAVSRLNRDAGFVELKWEVDTSGQLKLISQLDENQYVTFKPTKQQGGFVQIETQDAVWFDDKSYFQTGVGLMASALEGSLTTEELAGQWLFKWSEGANSYHSFVINEDASINRYAVRGNVTIEENIFTANYFYDAEKETYVTACSDESINCYLSDTNSFKVLSKENGTVLLATLSGEFHVAQHSKDLRVDHFIAGLMDDFSYYSLIGEHYAAAQFIRYNYEVDEYIWATSVPFSGTEEIVKLSDGKFHYQTSQGTYWVAPVMHLSNGIQVCIYEDGQSCEQGTQQTWLYQAPTFDITLKVGQGGAVNADTTLENVLFGNYIRLTILADEGYRIADFEGCNARFLWEISLSEALIEVAPNVSDCTLTVSFERDSGQSVVDSLGIKDSGLKSCVESQGLSYPQFLAFLNCNSSTIDSFSGIENFKYLLSISLYDTSLSAQAKADLENMTQLKSLHLYDVDYTELNLSKLSQLTTLSLSQASTVSTIVLPVQSSLYWLDISNSSVTEIDLSNQVKLRSLSVGESALTNLDLSNNLELELLNISGSKVEGISGVTTDHKIQSLNAASSALATLDLRNFDDVEDVDLTNTLISLLELGGNPQLHTLNASDSPLARINVEPGQYTLSYLALNNTNLKELDLRYFEQLSTLELTSTFLTSLDLTSNQQLFSLEASHNQLTEVNWGDLARIFSVNLAANPLDEFMFEQHMENLHQLDLSNTGIRVLHIPDGATLRSLKFSENQLDNITGVEYLSTVGSTFDLTNTTLSTELLQYIQSHNVSVIH